MRVGHIIFARPEMTGRDVVVSQLVRAQIDADGGTAILLAAGNPRYIDQMIDRPTPHLRFPAGHTPAAWLRSAWRYSRLDPRRIGVTLLHGHGCRSMYLLAALKIARRPGWSTLPIVYSNYGFFTDTVVHRLSTRAELLTARWADAITVSNVESRHYLLDRRYPVRVSVIPNGTSMSAVTGRRNDKPPARRLASRYGVPAGAPMVGIVGRLSREKRVDVFIAACRRISAERPDVHFFIVGSGPDEAAIRGLSERSGLDNIHVTGYYPDINDVYSSLDVLIHAADFEGLPLVVLEAMAWGVPVVATAVGGIRELIEDGRNGLLADRRDAPGLARAALTLLADPELSRRLTTAAECTVHQEHTIEAMKRAVAEVYARMPDNIPA